MADPAKDVEAMDGLLRKLEDIANSQAALVEKLATAQTQAEEAGLADLAAKLAEPFSRASRNADAIRELKGELESARNKARQAAAQAKPAP